MNCSRFPSPSATMMTIHAVPMITPKTVRMVRILRRHRLDAASATISKNVIVVHILLKLLRAFLLFLFEHDYDYHGSSACCNQNPSPPWETGLLRRNIFSRLQMCIRDRFGAYSGFDRIEDCFSDLTPHIHALETGLSSDPPMNWRLSALDSYTMVSNSDAHSPANLAREANLFNTELSYPAIAAALQNHDTDEFYGTLEFFPEEGKYHNDGHRNCKICLTPEETIAAGGKCPVCGRRITVGVLHRVVELADREPGYIPERHKHFESIVPLPEVVASSMGMTTASKKVKAAYEDIIKELGPELFILRDAPLEEISRKAGPGIAEGIRRLRCHEVEIHPGYDGEYGKILVMNKDDVSRFAGQISLFENCLLYTSRCV